MLLYLTEQLLNIIYAYIPRKKPSQSALQTSQIIAHRGAHDKSLGIIENTDEAFKRALDLGCWGIELDVHATADKRIVVNHDPTLTRLWGKDAAISDLDFQTLRVLVPEIPLLSEVIDKYGKKMHLFIELKSPFTAENELIKDLKDLTPCKDYHLLTLHEPVFAGLKQIPKEVMLLVAELNTKQYCKLSLEKGYGGVLGHYLLLNNRLVKALTKAHQHVGVGFVDSQYGLYREVNRDMPWLFTNNVGKIHSLI